MAEITGDLSTVLQPYCTEVTWEIRDFFRIPANADSRLQSASFPEAKADWRLLLYPNGRSVLNSVGWIDILLRRLNYSIARQRVEATFSIKNRDGENCKTYSIDYLSKKNGNTCGVMKFIKRSKLEEKEHSLLPGGTLTVHCQIKVERTQDECGDCKDESSPTDSSVASPSQLLDASSQTETPDACKGDGDLQRTSPSMLNLQTDYKKLLESKKEADVCLKLSDKEFRAHKCILGARSSVFSAMFEHDTEEKNSGEVVIKDLDPESFPDFLQHVYAGSVDNLSDENVFNLYIAADKYDIADLKSECKSYMERTLSVDTFCDVMILVLLYKEDELLKVAIDFFSKNLTKIIVTVKWQKFLKEHDTAANELFIKALVPADEK